MFIISDIKNFRNYLYTTSCFKEIVQNKDFKNFQLNITWLGVMYQIKKVQKGTSLEVLNELFTNEMYIVEQALMVSQCAQDVVADYRKLSEDDNFEFYIIKYIPVFINNISVLWLILRIAFFISLYYFFTSELFKEIYTTITNLL